MIRELEYLPEALDDLASLDNSVRKPVSRAFKRSEKILFPGKTEATAHLWEIKEPI